MANNAAGHRYLSNHNQVENNISDRGFISWCSSSRRTTQPTKTASSKPPSGSMTRWVKKSRKPNTFIPRSTDTSFQALNDSTERSEEHTSELQSRGHLVCRLLLDTKKQHFLPYSQ